MGRTLRGVMRRFDRRERVHFLHIGKTGGSAVRHALREVSGTDRHRFVMHPHQVTLADLPADEPVVVFVRGTVARFASGFRSRQRRGRPRYDVPWSAGEGRAFAEFHTPNELAEAISSTDAARSAAARDAMDTINHVRFALTDWLGDPSTFAACDRPMFVGFQESLDHDFDVLRNVLGLPPTMVLPRDDVAAHRTPRDVDQTIGDTGAANLRAWYALDEQLLELCRQRQLDGHGAQWT